LSVGSAEAARRNTEQLVEGLRQLGHGTGPELRVEQAYWNGEAKALQPLLLDTLAKRPDVLVVGGTTLVRAAKAATDSIPIVVANASDLVSSGVVRSYAHPGGNLTGLTTLTDVIMGKRLEILAEALPGIRRVALLQNPEHALAKSIESRIRQVAAAHRIAVHTVHVTNIAELEAALSKLGEAGADALLVSSHALFIRHSATLIERAMQQKVPVVHWQPHTANQGALLVQGVDTAKLHRRAATYVDKILKGARPGDLPIEQVTTDELIVNLKTAKALGLKVSQSVLLRADKVIQ
jgi:putative ABC transport system substrate-binding protein